MSGAMTDWSSYSQDRERIEYETRHKIAATIQEKIASERQMNTHFISALELANSIVLGFDPYEPNRHNQPALFNL